MYLVGDYGEVAFGFVCVCGFDGGVECQQVGLFGDVFDYFDHVVDLLGLFVQLLQGCGVVVQVVAELVHVGVGVFAVLVVAECHFVGLLRFYGSLFVILCDVLCGRGYLCRCGGDLVYLCLLLLDGVQCIVCLVIQQLYCGVELLVFMIDVLQ